MAGLNSQITALLGLGADAMDNLFDVNITLPESISEAITEANTPGMASYTSSFALRCQGFEPPHFTLKTYDVRYKTVGVKRPAARLDGDRVFKLQFRLDAYYNIYRILMAWRGLVLQPSSGFASNTIDDFTAQSLGTIEVCAFDTPVKQTTGQGYNANGVTRGFTSALATENNATSAEAQLKWIFKQVWLSDLDEPKFKTGAGDPQLVTATFVFGEYQEPQMSDILSSSGRIIQAAP